MIRAIQSLTISLLVGLMVTFVGLNWLVGCESWDQEICITPKRFGQMFLVVFK